LTIKKQKTTINLEFIYMSVALRELLSQDDSAANFSAPLIPFYAKDEILSQQEVIAREGNNGISVRYNKPYKPDESYNNYLESVTRDIIIFGEAKTDEEKTGASISSDSDCGNGEIQVFPEDSHFCY
jgi:hypothetical protein